MKKLSLVIISVVIMITACYDDYKEDFDYSATYFPIQQPIRTLIYDADQLTFQVGVVLAGKRSNDGSERVGFSVDPGLLHPVAKDILLSDSTKAIMPSNYYSIEMASTDSVMIIPQGSFQGLVRINLNENFRNDPRSVENHYVIPFQILSSTADSILPEKSYTLVAVKYINRYHGWYYQKGQQRKIDPVNGNVISTFIYSNQDIIDHRAVLLRTTSVNSLNVPAMGIINNNNFSIDINEASNTVTYRSVPGNPGVEGISGSYSPADRRFFLNFNYVHQDTVYTVFDTLYYRNTEMVYESW